MTMAGLQNGQNVLVDGSMRNASWYLKYIQELRSQFPMLKVSNHYPLEYILYPYIYLHHPIFLPISLRWPFSTSPLKNPPPIPISNNPLSSSTLLMYLLSLLTHPFNLLSFCLSTSLRWPFCTSPPKNPLFLSEPDSGRKSPVEWFRKLWFCRRWGTCHGLCVCCRPS